MTQNSGQRGNPSSSGYSRGGGQTHDHGEQRGRGNSSSRGGGGYGGYYTSNYQGGQ